MSELKEVDVMEELSKSENEDDIPEISIPTEKLDDANLDKNEESKITDKQKSLLQSFIEGTNYNSDNDSIEEGEVVEDPSVASLEEGEVVEDPVVSLEEGEVVEDPPVASLEEGEVVESKVAEDNMESTDDDTDDEDDRLINLDEDINKETLKFYHPETENINYKELLTLSRITKNKNGVIIDPLHKTLPFLTRYERAKILGQRAKQINHGANPFVDVPANIIDGHTIALMELNQKKIPFIIRRPLPNGSSEYWKVKDLKVI